MTDDAMLRERIRERTLTAFAAARERRRRRRLMAGSAMALAAVAVGVEMWTASHEVRSGDGARLSGDAAAARHSWATIIVTDEDLLVALRESGSDAGLLRQGSHIEILERVEFPPVEGPPVPPPRNR